MTLRNVSLLYRILNDENRPGTFDVKQNVYASGGGGFRPDKDARTTPRRKRPTTRKPQRTPTTISPPTRAFSGPSTLSSSPSEKFSIMQDNNRKKNPTPAYSRRRHDAILDALTKNRLEHHRLLQEERKIEGWTDGNGIICDAWKCKPQHNRLISVRAPRRFDPFLEESMGALILKRNGEIIFIKVGKYYCMSASSIVPKL